MNLSKQRHRIIVMLLGSKIITITVMALVTWLILSVEQRIFKLGHDLYINPFMVINVTLDARLTVTDIRNHLLFAALYRNKDEVAPLDKKIQDLDRQLQQNFNAIQSTLLSDLTVIPEIQQLLKEWRWTGQQILNDAYQGKFDEANNTIIVRGTPQYQEIINRLDDVVEIARKRAKQFAAQAEFQADKTLSTASALLAIGVLISLIFAAITIRKVLRMLDRFNADLQLAASVFDGTGDAVMITDANGLVLKINEAFTRITGFTANEVIGQMPRVIKSHRHPPEFYQDMWRSLLEQGQWQGQLWNRRRDGEAFLAQETITALRNREGQINRFVSVFSDVTEIYRKDEQIRHQAYHDALTGLPNRFLFNDRLEHAVDMAQRHETDLALLLLDLNRFKIVNDTLGHNVGDQLLVEIAERIRDNLRRSDTVARMGGDEFIIILTEINNPVEVTEIAEKIQEVVNAPLKLQGHDLHVGVSIGIAFYPRDGKTGPDLVKNADIAMYQAKQSGKDTFRFFDPTMNAHIVEWLDMEEALRQAVQRHEFMLFYQPKIDLQTGQAIGLEALIRWNRPGVGIIPPGQFITLAEEIGLIESIGDWVIAEACRQIADWQQRGLSPLRVAVNVSQHQFVNPHFSEQVKKHLDHFGVSPLLLEIELTESVVMSNPENTVEQILHLQEIGVLTSVDDFGTGYSSLSYLKRLPILSVKVDKSFVRNIHIDSDSTAIASAIQGMANALGLETVAEGIESKAEEDHLRTLGYPTGQGFKYSIPLSPADIEQWLAQQKPLA